MTTRHRTTRHGATALLALGTVLTLACNRAATPESTPQDTASKTPIANPGNGENSGRNTPIGGRVDDRGSDTNRLEPGRGDESRPSESQAVVRTASAGTSLSARLETTLDSSEANVGDPVQATLTSDVRDAAGATVLPSGTRLVGRVTEVVSARRVHKKSSLAFHFDHAVLPDGTETAVSAGEGFDGKGWTKKQGAIIGGSAAGGALLGQVLGKDTESTVGGAVVGGAIAAGIIMSHKGEDIVLSSGSTMDLTLESDVQVRGSSTS